MLVPIDFLKGFDSISWPFIYKSLCYLSFPKDTIKWITLFNKDIKQQCRQVGPITPYPFIIVRQIVTVLSKSNKNIQR